jgi:hypothetical protein
MDVSQQPDAGDRKRSYALALQEAEHPIRDQMGASQVCDAEHATEKEENVASLPVYSGPLLTDSDMHEDNIVWQQQQQRQHSVVIEPDHYAMARMAAQQRHNHGENSNAVRNDHHQTPLSSSRLSHSSEIEQVCLC